MKPSDKNPFLYRNIIERVRTTAPAFSNITLKRLCSNFFSLYNLSLDARYALKSSGQPDDELPPEASKLQAVRILLIAALS